MSAKKVISFCQKNVVLIAGIGIIVATHWGWSRLQHNPRLVPEEKRRGLPIMMGMKYISDEIVNKVESLLSGNGRPNDKAEAKK